MVAPDDRSPALLIAIKRSCRLNVIYLPEATAGLEALLKADAKRIRDALKQVAKSHPQRIPFAFLEDLADQQAFDQFDRHVQKVGMDEVIPIEHLVQPASGDAAA